MQNLYRPTTPDAPLKREARLNVKCDELASNTTAVVIAQGGHPEVAATLSLPFVGSKALLKLGETWVTSKYKRSIARAHQEAPFRAYCTEKYGWDEDDFNLVYWSSVGRVRRRLATEAFRQTSKIMHGWLPTAHMLGHISGNTQCPGCPCPDETLGHMLRCPHHLMARKREEIIAALRKKGIGARIPRRVLTAFIHLLTHYLCRLEGDPLRRMPDRSLRIACHQ